MTTKPQTGGPAFPSGLIDPSTPEDAIQAVDKGMTLRDYFAAKAMQGLISNEYVTEQGQLHARYNSLTHAAEISYRMADAMLKARSA